MNEIIISQIRQRLEILYQMVDELERSGGGGGEPGTTNYNDLTNKPSVNGHILIGSKTSSDLDLQPVISDLSTIRSGAALGATAVQPATMNQALSGKQDTLTFDTTPTNGSSNPVKSGGVYAALENKVDKVNGKGLSTNDFTNEDKSQISANKAGIGAVANAGAKNKLSSTLDLTYLKSINRSGTWADNVYTLNSISFTVTADGTVLVNGTPSAQTVFLLITKARLAEDVAAGNYTLSGCPSGGGESGSNYRIFAYNPSSTVNGATDTGDGVEVQCDYSHSKDANIAIVVGANKTVNNLTFSPMLRDAAIEDDTYQPYAPTNRELYEMILALQSGT